jgi:hypothetical protein
MGELTRQQKWYYDNRQRSLENDRKWRLENPEKVAERNRQYREAFKKKHGMSISKYYKLKKEGKKG